MKLLETSDRLQHILCLLVLFIHHGLRDNLITGISSVANVSAIADRSETFSSTKKIHNIGLYLQERLSRVDVGNDKNGWTYPGIGGVLSTVHFGILFPLILSPLISPRLRKYFLSASLLASGLLSLLTELSASENDFTGLLLLRFFQGLAQGLCYPMVFYMLEGSQSLYFVFPYFFIFLAPWLGSSFGTLLGWAENSFTGSYVMGSLSIILGGVIIFTSGVSNSIEKPEKPWVECLTSPALWSCVILCLTTTWALHTFIVGLSFTLYFRFDNNDLMWMVPIVIFVGGLITRLIAMAAMRLLRNNFLSPLNRRRVIIITGSIIAVISLILNGVTGLQSEYALFGVSILGVGGGIGLLLVGVRLNLHDLGPIFPTPFLLLGSIGSTFGAGLASLLFPIFAQIDSVKADIAENDSSWKMAWMIPIAPVTLACCIHMFLISVTPLPHQTLVRKGTIPVLNVNGTPDVMEEMDAKSFKSLKSAFSFKTAESRHRSRTVSFQTVADNVEIDLHSLQDSKSDDCVSIAQVDDEGENAEMKSVKSGVTSFKSANNSRSNSVEGLQYGVVLSARELDRTTAWLSTHHDRGAKLESQPSVEKETVERNILIALQW